MTWRGLGVTPGASNELGVREPADGCAWCTAGPSRAVLGKDISVGTGWPEGVGDRGDSRVGAQLLEGLRQRETPIGVFVDRSGQIGLSRLGEHVVGRDELEPAWGRREQPV